MGDGTPAISYLFIHSTRLATVLPVAEIATTVLPVQRECFVSTLSFSATLQQIHKQWHSHQSCGGESRPSHPPPHVCYDHR